MRSVYISPIDFRTAGHEYTIDQIVNDLYRDKLSPEIREYFIDKLGIEKVYKNRDLFDRKRRPERLVDAYVNSALASLKSAGKAPEEVGQLITINDNYQQLDPSPSVELVPRLGLRPEVRTDNKQGMACSALTQALRGAYTNSVIPNSGEGTLVMVGSFYTDWFLPGIERINRISDRREPGFLQFAYMLMFSDAVASAYVSRQRPTTDYSIEVRLDMMSTRKDTNPNAASKATARHTAVSSGPLVKIDVDSKRMRETCTRLSRENTSDLRSRFPVEYAGAKVANLHTAGRNFLDAVSEGCGLDRKKCEISYQILRESGNTGAVSSFQLMRETVLRGLLKKGDYGLMVDYGWEGADAFLYRVH